MEKKIGYEIYNKIMETSICNEGKKKYNNEEIDFIINQEWVAVIPLVRELMQLPCDKNNIKADDVLKFIQEKILNKTE